MTSLNKSVARISGNKVISNYDAIKANKQTNINQDKLEAETIKKLLESIDEASKEGEYMYETKLPIQFKTAIDKQLKSRKFDVATAKSDGLIFYKIYWGPNIKLSQSYNQYLKSNKSALEDYNKRLKDKKKELSKTELIMLPSNDWKEYWKGRTYYKNSKNKIKSNIKFSIL